MTRPVLRVEGYTLLELLTVICIILILAVLLLPAAGSLRTRAEKVACLGNIRNLYVGANSYMQDHNSWPQIPLSPTNTAVHDEQWIEALLAYGITRSVWVCPTMERLLGNPDINNPAAPQADYVPFPFDAKPATPFRWSNMPWFVEKGNEHGNGNLLIYMNGTSKELDDIKQEVGG